MGAAKSSRVDTWLSIHLLSVCLTHDHTRTISTRYRLLGARYDNVKLCVSYENCGGVNYVSDINSFRPFLQFIPPTHSHTVLFAFSKYVTTVSMHTHTHTHARTLTHTHTHTHTHTIRRCELRGRWSCAGMPKARRALRQ